MITSGAGAWLGRCIRRNQLLLSRASVGETVGLRFSRRLTGATVRESVSDTLASRLRFACT